VNDYERVVGAATEGKLSVLRYALVFCEANIKVLSMLVGMYFSKFREEGIPEM